MSRRTGDAVPARRPRAAARATSTRGRGPRPRRGVALRPHVKTHKTPGDRAAAAGRRCGRASRWRRSARPRAFVAPRRRRRVRRLPAVARRRLRPAGCATSPGDARVAIGVDSVEGAAQRRAAARRARPSRCWSRWTPATTAAASRREAGRRGRGGGQRAGLEVRGVFTFPGHSYAPDAGRVGRGRRGARPGRGGRRRCARPGSSRGWSAAAPRPAWRTPTPSVVTELRPGVYVFGDAQQWELGT